MPRLLLLLVASLSLCAPVFAATPPRRDLIEPPPWGQESLRGSQSAALGTVLAQWISFERGDEEYVEIGKRPSYGFNQRSFISFYQTDLKRSGNQIFASKSISLCRGEAGWYIKSRGMPPYGRDTREDVIFVDGSHVYFASYVHPPSLDPAPAAERAIASLCIANPVSVKPLVLPVAFSTPRHWLLSNPEQGGLSWPETLATYLDPAHPDEVLMLARVSSADVSAHGKAQAKAVEDATKRENLNVKMLSQVTHSLEPLCGDNFGVLLHYTATYRGEHLAFEQMTLIGSPIYTALYIHPVGTKANSDAMNALHTLCPLRTPEPSPTTEPTTQPPSLPTQTPEITPAPSPT